MNVLIVEDEEIAANNLEKQLKKINPDINIMAKLESIRNTVIWLSKNSPELIFLDIHLSDGLSFSIFEQIELNIPIIFTTAYDQYALNAFKVHSIDYLLKPIDIKELEASLNKYNKITSNATFSTENLHELFNSFTNKKEYQKRFIVYAGQKVKMIKTEDIAWFNGSDKGTFLHTFKNQSFDLDFSLEKLEKLLDPDFFFRINRNYIINIEAIAEMYTLTKSRIKIELSPTPKEETLVSFNRMSKFRKWLNK